MPALTVTYDALWDASYFLLLIGFSIGNIAFAWALARSTQPGRVVAFFYAAAAALTFTIIASELTWFTLPDPIAFWSYPLLQPLGRVLIGVWLWRMADEQLPLRPKTPIRT